MTNRWVNPINNNILRDVQNNVLANGSVQFYAADTTTPLAVYSDPELTVSLGSYLDADAYGLLPDFHLASGTQYKAVAYDAIGGASGLGAVKWTRDDTFGADSAVDSRLDSLESSVDSINVSRNAILNGGMRVPSQTGSVTLTSSYLEGGVAAVYGKVANVTAGTLLQTQDDDYQSGYTLHFSGVSTNNAAATVDAQFRIESKDCHQFMNGNGTFQCYVEHDVGSAVNYTVTVSVATALDDFSSITTILAGDAVSVATGTRTQLTLPVSGLGDVSNGIAITVSAACGTVTTKNFKVGDGQFELGLTATEFSELPYRVVFEAMNFDLGLGCYFLGEYSLTGGAVDFVDICSGGDLDADLSPYDYIIIEGQFKVASAVATSVAAVEVGTVSGGIVNTDVYQYLAKYITPSSTTYAAIDQNTSVSKAANFYYRPGDTTAAYRFRIVVKKPIAGFSPAYVQISSKCIFIDAPTSNAGTQDMEGYVNGVSDFDWVRLYCTSGAVAGDASGVDISDGIFRAYGTNNPGFAVV